MEPFHATPSASEFGTTKYVGDTDVGLKILEGHGVDQATYVFDSAMRKRILRKIDLRVLPILTFTTVFGFLDKQTLNYASIFGIIKDANLVGTQYSWLGSIYYFGYLTMQPLAAFLLQRFTPARCLSVAIMVWAVNLFLTVVCNTFAKLMAVRFFLGVAEGIVVPSFILISSAWYARQDQPLRVGVWFSANGLAQIIGGLGSFGLGRIHVDGISPWKWLYLIIAALTIFWSLFLIWALPTSQATAQFLTDEEKVAAVEMVRDNNTGIHNRTFQKEQLKEALLDPKSYIFFWFAFFGNLPNSVSTFGSLVISNFGFTSLQTTLLGMPNGAFEIIVMVAVTWFCIRFQNIRCYCVVFVNVISLVGGIMLFSAPFSNKAALLVGYYLIFAWPTGYAISLSIIGSNTAGHTKKVVTNVFTLAGFCSSNIIAPQFFKTNQKPRYPLGIGSTIFGFAGMIFTIMVFRFYVVWLNKKRAPMREQALAAFEGRREQGFEDLTDRENPLFLYVY
ncbi:MFS transporter [Halenospora varia]|nr:MFS transporter [Halenospora varia]